ncbi:hypothetical protein U1Q18_051445 [Sarracenia purpurea var. burkii]
MGLQYRRGRKESTVLPSKAKFLCLLLKTYFRPSAIKQRRIATCIMAGVGDDRCQRFGSGRPSGLTFSVSLCDVCVKSDRPSAFEQGCPFWALLQYFFQIASMASMQPEDAGQDSWKSFGSSCSCGEAACLKEPFLAAFTAPGYETALYYGTDQPFTSVHLVTSSSSYLVTLLSSETHWTGSYTSESISIF